MQLYTDLFLANCPDMVFLLNERLRVIACSEACLPLLRVAERAFAAGKPLTDIFSVDVDDMWVRDIHRRNEAVMSDRLPCRSDDAIMQRGGAVMHVQVSIAPMLDEGGACHGTIMTIKDITELIETQRRAEEASRSKSSFLANMSHEIRTPMNAVKGLSELLALTELSSLQRNYIKNIISSANSLLGIINDILDFSKIDANKIEYIEGPYNLPSLITGVCNVVSVRADDKNLLMLIDVPPDLPATLFGDDVRIKQVITNLLSNAVKYTNEGYVRFSACTEKRGGRNMAVLHSGGQRHRHPAGGHSVSVRRVFPGRPARQPQRGGHGPRAGHCQAAGRGYGRRHRGGQHV